MTDVNTAVVPYEEQVPGKPVEAHPWDKQPGETVRSYGAFLDFRDMGSGRALTSLHKHYLELTKHAQNPSGRAVSAPPPAAATSCLQVLKDWSRKHYWFDRAGQWDQWMANRESEIWAQRRAELRESNWDDGEMLRDVGRQIMEEVPKFRTIKRRFVPGKTQQIIGQDGREYTVQLEPDREVVTVAVNAELGLRAVKTGSDLQKDATGDGESAERITIEGTVRYEKIPRADLDAIRGALMARVREAGNE